MDENEPEEDPFSSLTAMCHVTASQQDLIRSAALVRQHERFPTDHSQEEEYSVPVETVCIRMESPEDEEEFLTPDDDSLSALSSQEPILSLDLPNDPTLLDDLLVVKRKADKVFDNSLVDGSEGCSVGAQVDGFIGDEAFAEMPVGKKPRVLPSSDQIGDQVFDEMLEKKNRAVEGYSVGTQIDDLIGDKVLDEMAVGRKSRVLIGSDEVDSVGDQVFDEMLTRDKEVKMGFRGISSCSTEVVGLEEDCVFGVMKDDSKMDLDVDTSTQVVDSDDKERCGNGEAGRGDENITTQVVDLDGNGTFGNLSMRNVDVERGKFTSADVDLDEDELYDDLTTRNLLGKSRPKEGDEGRGGEIRRFSENGIEEIDNGKCASLDDENCQKDIGNRKLYDNLSQREKEIENALNIGSSDIEEIDKPEENNEGISVGGSRKPCGNNPSSDVIRGLFRKQANTSKGDNNQQKGKSQARKLPSTLDMPVKTAVSESNVTHIESNKGAVGKNRCENEISNPVGGETTNDQIMKNLLDGLDLIIGEKEKVYDGSNEEVDILQTAIRLGLKFPRPRWWPEEGFDDD